MSRLPYMNCESGIPDVSDVANTSLLPVYSPQDIRTRQLEDNLIGHFLRAKEIGDQSPPIEKGPKWHKMVQLWNQLFVKNGTLYRLFSGTEGSSSMMQLVALDSLKEKILYGVHKGIGGGHLGVEKLVAKLKERYYWPGHYNDVQSWCANCGNFITWKTVPPHHQASLQPVRVRNPMEMVAIDIMGQFPKN